jgi:hypothetical protein
MGMGGDGWVRMDAAMEEDDEVEERKLHSCIMMITQTQTDAQEIYLHLQSER